MNQESLENIANSIILDLAEQGLTCTEAIGVMKIADGKIRKSRAVLFEKASKASLKSILREAESAGAQKDVSCHG